MPPPIVPNLQSGMGSIPHQAGVTFRVWAPHATELSVIGTFNEWKPNVHPLVHEANGYWAIDVPIAKIGDEYRFHLVTPNGIRSRIDPYTRAVTNSVGNSIVADPFFDWGASQFKPPRKNEWVIYELHVGTFNDTKPIIDQPSTFSNIICRFDHLKKLGVNALQIMPVAEFAGNRSWGYNPAHIFAVEQTYGGPKGFKQFIKAAHDEGFAVILDVVYNHFGPSDLDLWRFDGWSENDGGGIYFYNDWRKSTPWGDTRPDYGRPEVRQYIRDNALMWLDEYHVDGLRMDMTLFIRSVRADGEANLPDGWSLMQRINHEIHERYPHAITIAEDLQKSDWLTKPSQDGGAGFGSQWDDQFVHSVREAVIATDDGHRSMDKVSHAITHRYNADAFERVIYFESHDDVANGRARVAQEIDPDGADNVFAQKRSTLAAGLIFTSPGIPMLFQGQEFLEGGWFRDTVPVDWDRQEQFHGIVRLYRDLIHLRTNKTGETKGLTGQRVDFVYLDDRINLIAWLRRMDGGPGDDVFVAANFSNQKVSDIPMALPVAGQWKLLFNSDWTGYSKAFGNVAPHQTIDSHGPVPVTLGAYSLAIYGRTN